jgi:hypothetical protein
MPVAIHPSLTKRDPRPLGTASVDARVLVLLSLCKSVFL